MKLQILACLFTATIAAATQAAQIQKVEFTSDGQKIIGQLYLPDNYKAGRKIPGVVVTGAWMTVKEQMPTNYAETLAKKGYAAMIFDFRGWGESKEGKLTQFMESPTEKTKDIIAAANYMSTRPEISSVNGLGICASSGYMAKAAVDTPAIKSIALVAPWLHDNQIVEQVYGGKEGVQKLIEAARNPVVVTAASTTDKSAIMFNIPYYTETKRGMIPAWDNKFNTGSWTGWLTFDAIAIAKDLKKPTLIVHSDAAAIPQGAKAFYKDLPGKKNQVWLDKVSQFDFYDQPKNVSRAVAAAAKHFKAVK